MSIEAKSELIVDLETKQKISNIESIPEDANIPLLLEEKLKEDQNSHINDSRSKIASLKIKIQPEYSNNSHSSPDQQSYLLLNFKECVMFPSPINQERQPTMSLRSFPSNLADENEKPLAVENDENIEDWISKYYMTTSCMTMFILKLLRFIRMACILLPVISMIGSLFTHTKYIDFTLKKISQLWALILGIEKNSSLAKTLGGTIISIVAFIVVAVLCRIVWSKLVKKKFLTTCDIGLKEIKGFVFYNFTFFDEKLANHMRLSGIIGNEANPTLKKHAEESQLKSKTFKDCEMLYRKYSTLIQRYNVDRMGPYDIAKERQASQFRLLSIFLLLVVGLGSEGEEQQDIFRGYPINYGVIYNIILGMIEDACQQSKKDHRTSKYFTWLKKITKSHYALMLKRLVEDAPDKHPRSLEMYKQCDWIKPFIMKAETQAEYVSDNEHEARQLRIR